MSSNLKPKDKKRSRIEAGAAGAGGGTLLVLLANNLSDSNEWKSWLLIIAPSASIGLSAFWLWTKDKIIKYFKKRELSKSLQQVKVTLNEALENPRTSAEHKKYLSKEMENFERLQLENQIKQVKLVSAELEAKPK